jgi:hypothetical protein
LAIRYKAQELMDRTMTNLGIIDSLHSSNRSADGLHPFEVTQLVSSFQGALAYPWEKLRIRHHGDEPWDIEFGELEKRYGFPKLCPARSDDTSPENFRDMIQQLRNGMAHGNIEFYSDLKREIGHIEVWNQQNGRRTWGTSMTAKQMRQFLEAFVRFAKNPLVIEERECASS